jgi:hypothetical protein
MTLCGVLKDVLLVMASMAIWGDPVTGIQFVGYSIALSGMVYYKTGPEKVKGYFAEVHRQWADFGTRQPVLRKISIIVLGVFATFTVLGGFSPLYHPALQMGHRWKTKSP